MTEESEISEPVVKYKITKDLENCKRAFMNKQFDVFLTEVLSGDFIAYEAVYKYNSDYDGATEFVIRNRVSGMGQSFDKNRRYYFTAIKCVQTGTTYSIKSYWLVNTDLKPVLNSDYDDHEWTQVDLKTDSSNFVENFRDEGVFASKYVH
ncbi:MAG: putative ORFan [Harvfovirus sp.]|uniref:Putative ORFan n=1 Tax=Harvfovirus sp. TaxID=2487768 RepID=A0A3G5A5A9_9VIRU|nr:MAG: putative ORFan [Harvfovirus sp.]